MPLTFSKTSHQLANELLTLEDLPLRIEEWFCFRGSEPAADVSGDGKSIFIFKVPCQGFKPREKPDKFSIHSTPGLGMRPGQGRSR